MLGLVADDDHVAAPAGQHRDQGVIEIKLLALLVECHHFQVGAETVGAPVGSQLASQHLQERGLTGTIRPDKTDPVTTLNAR